MVTLGRAAVFLLCIAFVKCIPVNYEYKVRHTNGRQNDVIEEPTYTPLSPVVEDLSPVTESAPYRDDGIDYASIPFKFSYELEDGAGSSQHREEEGDGKGVVRGSYGYTDPHGMYRHVSYVADDDGFHVILRSNEPGVANRNSADVAVVALDPPAPIVEEMQRYAQRSSRPT